VARYVLAFDKPVSDSLLTALQHCYVTGGSSGLGQSLAVLLAKAGANVSVVARNQGRLNKTLSEMEVCRDHHASCVVLIVSQGCPSLAEPNPQSLLLLTR
jgi:NAD(P)-dependent dehydrogenase (short-subunit alcohol dehydrogenase family)